MNYIAVKNGRLYVVENMPEKPKTPDTFANMSKGTYAKHLLSIPYLDEIIDLAPFENKLYELQNIELEFYWERKRKNQDDSQWIEHDNWPFEKRNLESKNFDYRQLARVKTEKKKLQEGFIDWNKLSLDDLVTHLKREFGASSSGTAKAVYELIKYYERTKTKDVKEAVEPKQEENQTELWSLLFQLVRESKYDLVKKSFRITKI